MQISRKGKDHSRLKKGAKTPILFLIFILVVGGIFGNAQPINAAACTLQGNTISVNCDFPAGTYYYNGTFTVDAGITVTAGSASAPGAVTIQADDFVINGTISANGVGNAGGTGSCPGTSSSEGGGACHGGNGGRSSTGITGGTASYDTVIGPTTMGSGGGDDTGVAGVQGGAGGGAIKIITSATGTVDMGNSGLVTANGSKGDITTVNQAGGGSGGSIWITTGTISGSTFVVTANGGDGTSGTSASTSAGGGGGGGRIAISYSTNNVTTLTHSAAGGNRGGTNMSSQPGGAGTVYLWDTDLSYGDLYVNNSGRIDSPFTRPTAGDNPTVGNLTITNGAQLYLGSTNTLTVSTGGTVTGGGSNSTQPQLWVVGTFNAPSEAWTIAGLNVHHTGTMGVVKYLTYDNGIYSVDTSSALFSAGRGNRLEGLTISGTSGYTIFSTTSTAQLFVDTLTVKSGAVITSASNSTTALGTQHRLVVSASTSLDVESGGNVNLDGKGFSAGQGTGVGGNSFSGCGSAHGGNGGTRTGNCTGGTAYGSPTSPSTLGSGGGTGTGGTGGSGGGSVYLAAPTMTISGTVSANSATTGSSNQGGGSGGSVWIAATTLLGSGSITTNAINTASSAGGGGGGRIAIYTTTDSSTVTKAAYGGNPSSLSDSNRGGGAGTIYTKDDAEVNGSLVVKNDKFTNTDTPQVNATETYDNLTISDGAWYEIGSGETLTVASGGTFTSTRTTAARSRLTINGTFNLPSATQTMSDIDVFQNATVGVVTDLTLRDSNYWLNTSTSLFTGGAGNRLSSFTLGNNTFVSTTSSATLFLNTLTMNSGSVLVHASNTGVRQNVLNISATTSITVNSGAIISLTGRGHAGQTGPCKGITANVGSGAAHGGDGGRGAPSVFGPIGVTGCDSVTQPIEPGSGGGDNTSTGGITTGEGGGALKLSVNSGGTIAINGTINADGTGTSGSGGGAGGAIWIDAPSGTVSGSGTITAVGGNGGSGTSSGGGGGGRVAVYYSGATPSFTYDLRGGTGYESGGAGTIYTKSAAQSNGSLTVDNISRVNNAYTTQSASNTSITFDVFTVKGNGNYRVPPAYTTTVASAADCSGVVGGGTEDGALTVDGTFVGPNSSCTFTDLDIHHNGNIATITALTMASATYSVNTANALFTDGIGDRLTSLTLGSNGVLSTSSTAPFYIGTLIANSGSFLTHAATNTTGSATSTLYVSATTSIAIASGAIVDLTGRGYDRTVGPGQGTDGSTASGGGHGGVGGTSSIGGAGGTTYGSAEFPTDLGSGGGDDTNSTGGSASQGGGSIRLVSPHGTLTIGANIVVDGAAGNLVDDGGGSGGSIFLLAGTITITANLKADGGAGASASAGCGGGGRIAVYTASLTYSSGTATAATGCAGARAGDTGSVFFGSAAAPSTPPVNSAVIFNPSVLEVGQNIIITSGATDDIGILSTEIYLDGTEPANLVKTCTFDPLTTPSSCVYEAGALSTGSHSVLVISYNNSGLADSDTTNFTVAGRTTSNNLNLSRTKTSAAATVDLTFTLTGTSTGTLTLTFPSGFTVNSAATSGSSCLSAFGFTSSTMYATKTGCVGTVTMTGGTVTNPTIAGTYTITWTNDNGSAQVYITNEDVFNISASVDPIITFNIGSQSAVCDGAFAGNGGTLALSTLTTSGVTTSDVSSVPHICTRLSTNATGGAVVTVRSLNAALASVSTPAHTIPSGSATLVAGTTGYGLCAGDGGSDTGRDATTPVGAAPTRVAPFNGACSTTSHDVGALTTSAQTVWSVSDPTQNAFALIFIKAAISGAVMPHDDYADTLTFIATATY